MRLIDADALIKHLDDAIKDAKRNGEICDYWEDDRSNLLYYLDNAPTIDAVPIVRCRECKYNINNPRAYNDDDPIEFFVWCEIFRTHYGEDAYCSCGKRAER